jgi:hypothetical protein
MQTQPGTREAPGGESAAGEEFRWLPASPLLRVLLWILFAAFIALVFSAYLSPNMVFDLANIIFCG